jgi:hypothetical protein
LSVALAANTKYRFQAYVQCSTAGATTGIQFGIAFSGTLTSLSFGGTGAQTGSIPILTSEVTALNTKMFATTPGPAATVRPYLLWGTIVVGGSGGTFDLQFCSGVSGNQVTINVNGYIEFLAVS